MSGITKRLEKLERRNREQVMPDDSDGFMAALGFADCKNRDFISALSETAKSDWADYK